MSTRLPILACASLAALALGACTESHGPHEHALDAALQADTAADDASPDTTADTTVDAVGAGDTAADAVGLTCQPACQAGQVCCADAHGHGNTCVTGTTCP